MKKIIAVALILLMVLPLAACAGEVQKDTLPTVGGTNSPGQAGSTDEENTSPAETQAQTEAGPVKLSDVLINIHYEYSYKGEPQITKDLPITYDAKGNMTHGIVWHEEPNYITVLYAVYEYDNEGRVIWSDNEESNGWVLNWYYLYDDAGRLIRRDSKQEHAADGTYISYEYDAEGNLVHTWEGRDYDEYYTAEGLVQGPKCDEEWFYTYEGGKLTHAQMLREYNGWSETYDYTYNANGLLSEVLYTSHYGTQYLTTNTYDAAGRLIRREKTYETKGETITSRLEEFTYDAQGRILTHIVTENTKGVHTLTYSYGDYTPAE